MCEFCVRHGDGKKWYLKAENYPEELLHDAWRAGYIEVFIPETNANAKRWALSGLRSAVSWLRREGSRPPSPR